MTARAAVFAGKPLWLLAFGCWLLGLGCSKELSSFYERRHTCPVVYAWVADSLLFVLVAHKVIRNSGAPSEKVLAGHRMNGLAEVPLQPSHTSGSPPLASVLGGENLVVVAHTVAQQRPGGT